MDIGRWPKVVEEEGDQEVARAKAVMHPISVRATKDGTGEYELSPESEIWDAGGTRLLFQKDRHGMAKDDYHLIEFVLDDHTGSRLKFPSVPHDAMWVMPVEDRSNPRCPDKDSVSDYSVMEPICVCDGGRRLIVRNDNPRKEDWSFTLNFVPEGADESDASTYANWDPIGSNQNGGSGAHER